MSRTRPLRKRIRTIRAKFWDILLSPFTLIAAIWFKRIRKFGLHHMPISKAIFQKTKILPIRDHYYEPLITRNRLDRNYRHRRKITSIDWNDEEQIELLNKFSYQQELALIPIKETSKSEYFYENGMFPAGDSDYLYSLIRHIKPAKILDIGSGFSTLISLAAVQENKKQDSTYQCKTTCVEPYRNNWLEEHSIQLIRKPIENLDASIVESLDKGDILFVDSSHMIRPQGDVLHEFFELFPYVKSGVFLHIHDIFSPQDYPNEWIIDDNYFWNEQYLLEAFMSYNSEFRVIGALNYLRIKYPDILYKKLPMAKKIRPDDNLNSFWITRN